LICFRRHITLKRWFDCEKLHETARSCDDHGICLGDRLRVEPVVAQHNSSREFVAVLLCSAATSLLIGICFVWSSSLIGGAAGSLLCWGMLGVAAVCIQEQPRRADHVLSLVDAGKIDLKTPLRYYGQLADEPEKLAWGVSYDIELSGVEYEGRFVPASGGLRLGYIARADHPAACVLHEGDSIAVVTRAKLPQMYRDAGAFERRGMR
jgi:hypothetical protein